VAGLTERLSPDAVPTLSAQPLDISHPRDIGGLISRTFDLYRRHFGLFATLALGTVLVVEGIVYGLGDADHLPTVDNALSGGLTRHRGSIVQ
jgi:hypothetical protein